MKDHFNSEDRASVSQSACGSGAVHHGSPSSRSRHRRRISCLICKIFRIISIQLTPKLFSVVIIRNPDLIVIGVILSGSASGVDVIITSLPVSAPGLYCTLPSSPGPFQFRVLAYKSSKTSHFLEAIFMPKLPAPVSALWLCEILLQ